MLDEARRWGRLATAAEEQEHRQRASSAPGDYHGDIAARELHWYDGRDWVRLAHNGGWESLGTARREDASIHDDGWRPWTQSFDESAAPFYRWFCGGLTNACFNEVDRHVLDGRGRSQRFCSREQPNNRIRACC